MKEYKNTIRIFLLCLMLQVLQSFFPQIADYQAFVLNRLYHLNTLPLGILGLITHMFSHAGWGHLIGNFTLGLPCMMYLEDKIGHNKLLEVYVISGLVACLAQMSMPFSGGGLIGASGAIFGCFGAACMALPKEKPFNLMGSVILAMLMLPELQELNLGFLAGNIAHAAHIAGGIAGIVMMNNTKLLRKRPSNR